MSKYLLLHRVRNFLVVGPTKIKPKIRGPSEISPSRKPAACPPTHAHVLTRSRLTQQAYAAALRSSLTQQPYAAALRSSLTQQPYAAALRSSLTQQPYAAALRSSLTQQPYAAGFRSRLTQQAYAAINTHEHAGVIHIHGHCNIPASNYMERYELMSSPSPYRSRERKKREREKGERGGKGRGGMGRGEREGRGDTIYRSYFLL
jgi:hypothetical protein